MFRDILWILFCGYLAFDEGDFAGVRFAVRIEVCTGMSKTRLHMNALLTTYIKRCCRKLGIIHLVIW